MQPGLLSLCLWARTLASHIPFLSMVDMSDINPNPGGYIKRTLTGSIQFTMTSIFEKRGVGNGHISIDFISLN